MKYLNEMSGTRRKDHIYNFRPCVIFDLVLCWKMSGSKFRDKEINQHLNILLFSDRKTKSVQLLHFSEAWEGFSGWGLWREEGRRGGKEACSSALLARGATLAFTLSYKDGLHISKRPPPPPLSYVLVRVIDCSLRNIKSDRSSAIKDGELFAEANFYNIYYRTVLPGILVSTFKYLSISEGKKRKPSFFVSIYTINENKEFYICIYLLLGYGLRCSYIYHSKKNKWRSFFNADEVFHESLFCQKNPTITSVFKDKRSWADKKQLSWLKAKTNSLSFIVSNISKYHNWILGYF